MKRRRILMLAGLGLVAAIVFLAWPRGPKEPVYEGKGISFWITELNKYGNIDIETARKIVRTHAAQSRRYLMSELTRRDPKWLTPVRNWVSDNVGLNWRAEHRYHRTFRAASGLYLLGPDLVPALPALVECLGDDDGGEFVAWAFSGAREAAIPFLSKALDSTNAQVAANAASGIVRLAYETESLLPTLFQWLQDSNVARRDLAARALGEAAFQTNQVVMALTHALADPEWNVRLRAATGLRKKGAAARPAVPELLRLMTTTNLILVHAASNAVRKIDPAALPAPRPPP